jgi:hypothetical protein
MHRSIASLFVAFALAIASQAAAADAPDAPSVPGGPAAETGVKKTIEQIYAEKTSLDGKTVTVSGEVTRVTRNVMKRNFLHLRDGTGEAGSSDITVTSQQTAEIGDHVTVTGRLAIDQDFGAGYTYPAIIEDATITKIAK